MRKILVCTLISALVLGVTVCGASKSSNVDKRLSEYQKHSLDLYKLYNTNIHEKIEMMKKQAEN